MLVNKDMVVSTLDLTNKFNSTITYNSLLFTFYSPFSISKIDPFVGSELGGTVIRIKGNNIPRLKHIQCQFEGVASLNTEWLSLSMVTCISPRNIPTHLD